jgi:hypothetical protein
MRQKARALSTVHVVLETAGLNDIEPGAYCREVGISLRTLKRWRRAVLVVGTVRTTAKAAPAITLTA